MLWMELRSYLRVTGLPHAGASSLSSPAPTSFLSTLSLNSDSINMLGMGSLGLDCIQPQFFR